VDVGGQVNRKKYEKFLQTIIWLFKSDLDNCRVCVDRCST